MARVFIDGFESGSFDLWDVVNNMQLISAPSNGLDGDYAAKNNSTNNSYLHKNITSLSEIYVGVRLKVGDYSNRAAISFYNSTTCLLVICRNTTSGCWQARLSSPTGTLLGEGTIATTLGQVIQIEVRYIPNTSSGVVQVKINGVLDINYSGNTTPGATSVNGVRLNENTTGNPWHVYDNFIIDNSAWPGNTRIQAIKPTAAGNSTQWTPDTGSNWDRVDEVPPSDTDYNWCNQANLVDLFTFGDLQGQVDTVKCVQVQARAVRNGDPMPTKLQLGVRSDGVNYFSSSLDVTTSAKGFAALWETDPATSQAWTVNGVNNAEFGYKSAA